jgi:hypothetical protein
MVGNPFAFIVPTGALRREAVTKRYAVRTQHHGETKGGCENALLEKTSVFLRVIFAPYRTWRRHHGGQRKGQGQVTSLTFFDPTNVPAS